MKTESKKKRIVLCVILAVVIALLAVLGVRITKRSSWGVHRRATLAKNKRISGKALYERRL